MTMPGAFGDEGVFTVTSLDSPGYPEVSEAGVE